MDAEILGICFPDKETWEKRVLFSIAHCHECFKNQAQLMESQMLDTV